jgi:hypothetical protein
MFASLVSVLSTRQGLSCDLLMFRLHLTISIVDPIRPRCHSPLMHAVRDPCLRSPLTREKLRPGVAFVMPSSSLFGPYGDPHIGDVASERAHFVNFLGKTVYEFSLKKQQAGWQRVAGSHGINLTCKRMLVDETLRLRDLETLRPLWVDLRHSYRFVSSTSTLHPCLVALVQVGGHVMLETIAYHLSWDGNAPFAVKEKLVCGAWGSEKEFTFWIGDIPLVGSSAVTYTATDI